MIFAKILFGLVTGYAMTQLHNPTTFFTPKWRLIVRFVIGWIGSLPVVLLLLPRTDDDSLLQDVATAHLAAAAIVGCGVVVGYMRSELVEADE